MTSNRFWKFVLPALVAGLSFITPTFGQAAGQQADSSANSFVHVYDVTKEIKVEGSIQKIETGTTDLPLGTHVLIQTAQGVVDAHLGSSTGANPSYLGITEGQNVTLVGMMETFAGNQILLARLMTTPSHIFVLRNEHGIPVRGVPTHSHFPAQTQKGGL
jgi:hypothetical protein